MAYRHRGTGELIRRGHVYVLRSDSLGNDVFKIGMSTGDVNRRANDVSKGFKITGLHALFAQPTSDAYQLEKRVHLALDTYRLRSDHPLSQEHRLTSSREFFIGLDLQKIERIIKRNLAGLEAEDSWCQSILRDAELVNQISGLASLLNIAAPDIRYWIAKLAANGSQPVAEFTFRQIAKGVKHTPGKTSYLTWRFESKGRAWFDPTYPRAAANLIHRRFDGDKQLWESLLGEDAVYHEYRNSTELRFTLWTPEHMEALNHVTSEVMPKVTFLT